MDTTIFQTLLPHEDPDASLAFYRDTLGFEVRNDVAYGGMHWLTVGPPDQPDTSIVMYPPAATPGITDDERRTIAEMMAAFRRSAEMASIESVTLQAPDPSAAGTDPDGFRVGARVRLRRAVMRGAAGRPDASTREREAGPTRDKDTR